MPRLKGGTCAGRTAGRAGGVQWRSITLSDMAWKTCYQPHAADPTGPVVAHAVSNENPNVSVAGEQLRNPIADEDWPGNGPPCSSCSSGLGL